MPGRPASKNVVPTAAAIASAAQGGLVYVSDADPGLRRKRIGKGFGYVDAKGRAVRDRATLERIRALAIPPAYRDVWICTRANGHLQATGRDARGRKQYRYHPTLGARARRGKVRSHHRLRRRLPRLRRRLRRTSAQAGLPRDKVLAMVVVDAWPTRSCASATTSTRAATIPSA